MPRLRRTWRIARGEYALSAMTTPGAAGPSVARWQFEVCGLHSPGHRSRQFTLPNPLTESGPALRSRPDALRSRP
ncbi:hypothetical protein BU52_22430 [Streptomyces toyocaensis]|uniref:Uncharacterized protein n=1 Tax=Streptomyces toyocaensis TaxID=55952 RepID=A0A081XN60_STRTO|nr:hypothetical protein BU52_22430 [Streptomyces toyocaensis]